MVLASEPVWQARARAEVANRVEWLCGARRSAVIVVAVLDTADGEVGPARRVAVVVIRVGYAASVGLEEVDLRDARSTDLGARKDDEEGHYNPSCDEEEGY